MSAAALVERIRGRVAFWALAGVALLIAHDATFLVQLGPGEGLARTLREAGHDYWGAASLGLALAGIVAAAATVHRIRWLRRRAAALGAPARRRGGDAYPRRALGAWVRLFAVVAVGFVVQENLEHAASHDHALGLGALLGPEYPLALPVIGLITALASLAAAALHRTERRLLAAIAAAIRTALARAPRTLPRPPLRLPPARRSPMAAAVAGRAPPRGPELAS